MIVYRTQASSGETWVTHWEPTAAAARKTARNLVAAGFTDPHVNRVDVPGGGDGLVLALNHADVHRMNWDGEPVSINRS